MSKSKKSEQYFRDKIEIFIRLFDEHCSPFWKSLTPDVTSYWQADCTTDFLGDTSLPPCVSLYALLRHSFEKIE